MMLRWTRLALASLIFCLGATCEVSCNGVPSGPGNPNYVALDLTTARFTIIEQTGGGEADVSATIGDSANRGVELMDGQDVQVNGEPLAGPAAGGKYTARIDVAENYQVKAIEPTRGVFTTDVAAPASFAITQPAAGGNASLSGFTLKWSNADAALAVRIELEQTLSQLNQTHRGKVELNTDTGSHTFSASFLSTNGFQQGAPIKILITKIATRIGLDGFGNGRAAVERSLEGQVTPVP